MIYTCYTSLILGCLKQILNSSFLIFELFELRKSERWRLIWSPKRTPIWRLCWQIRSWFWAIFGYRSRPHFIISFALLFLQRFHCVITSFELLRYPIISPQFLNSWLIAFGVYPKRFFLLPQIFKLYPTVVIRNCSCYSEIFCLRLMNETIWKTSSLELFRLLGNLTNSRFWMLERSLMISHRTLYRT